MKSTIKGALVALTLTCGAATMSLPAAAADVTVGISPGGIAFGYSEGYWDNGRQWHNWQNQEAAQRFRTENKDHYYEHPQARDRKEGAREDDKWWDRR